MPLSTALIIAAALLVVAVAAGLLWRGFDGRRRSGAGRKVRTSDLDLTALAERTTIVLFSTETCARCPQVRRMLRGIADERDGVEQVDVDLTHRPDLASRYGILQTPTTFLVSPTGDVTARFSGVPRPADIQAALAGPSPVLETR